MNFFAVFFQFLFMALWLVILGRVLMSWIDPQFKGPLGRFLLETTEPILGPIRRVLPQSGMLDFSPLVALIALSLLMSLTGFR